jgi:hypothetical protein
VPVAIVLASPRWAEPRLDLCAALMVLPFV